MSKVQIQFKSGETLKVGDNEYRRIAGDFDQMDGQVLTLTLKL